MDNHTIWYHAYMSAIRTVFNYWLYIYLACILYLCQFYLTDWAGSKTALSGPKKSLRKQEHAPEKSKQPLPETVNHPLSNSPGEKTHPSVK